MGDTRILVPSELFAPAESSYFDGTYDIDVLKAGPDLYEFEGPLKWQATVSNTGGALLLTGTVEGVAKTSCARCLNAFTFPVTGELEGYYLLSDSDDAPDDMDDDEYEYLPKSNVIELDAPIKAALLLELPLIPLCDDDCKGICATCGADLNEGPCACEKQDEDEAETEPANPFSVLKDFPFEN